MYPDNRGDIERGFMKKFYRYIFIAVCALWVFLLTACNSNDQASEDYIADNEHCVISLPQDYSISCDNDEVSFDINLYNAATVNGKEKKEDFVYYKVQKNAPFRILTPLGIIQNRLANSQPLVYWKLNDTLLRDGDKYYSANTFTCNEDTEITPVYYEFRPVGMLLYAVDENHLPTAPDGEFFDSAGNIKEQTGVHYLYGVYDFEPHQSFWRTNLTLDSYVVNCTMKQVAENYEKNVYTVTVGIEKGDLFETGTITVETLCKIDGHGYFSYGSREIIGENMGNAIYSLSIGEHTLKYSFIE